jgi:hypothetical protein
MLVGLIKVNSAFPYQRASRSTSYLIYLNGRFRYLAWSKRREMSIGVPHLTLEMHTTVLVLSHLQVIGIF